MKVKGSFRALTGLLIGAFLAACSSSSGGGGGPSDFTQSGFRTPSSNSAFASIPVILSNETNARIHAAGIGGAAYVIGTDGSGAKAYAGIMPGSDTGATVTAGTVDYATNYEVLSIDSIRVSGGLLTGNAVRDSGSMTLSANFDAGTVTGSGGLLSVDGDISGSRLTGNVTYRGVSGNLTGQIGQDAAIGAFHGNSSTLVYGGGFIGTP